MMESAASETCIEKDGHVEQMRETHDCGRREQSRVRLTLVPIARFAVDARHGIFKILRGRYRLVVKFGE